MRKSMFFFRALFASFNARAFWDELARLPEASGTETEAALRSSGAAAVSAVAVAPENFAQWVLLELTPAHAFFNQVRAR